jgi:16S rRNA G1207 methylase RsmC
MPVNQTILSKIKNINFRCDDFMYPNSLSYINKYDRIIANPPFTNNQDIDHIRQMYDFLKPGGRVVSIASKHWTFSNNKKETEFRDWLDKVNAEVQDVDAGAFKESGTNISTCIIIINK